MLKKIIVFLFFIQCYFAYSQQLEEQIYTAVDVFNNSKSELKLEELEKKEVVFKSSVSTKSEQVALVYLQCNKAYYLKQQGNFKKAIKAYENAWQNYAKNNLKGYDIIEYCLKPLGNLYTITKDYTNAENTIRNYIFLAEKEKNQQQKIAGIINLSILYQTIGKHNDVLKLTDKTLKLSKISDIQRQKLTNISTKSKIALNLLNDYVEVPKLTINSYQYHINSSQLALKNKDFELAKEHFNKAKKIFIKQQNFTARELAKIYFFEAQLFLKLGNIEASKNSLDKSLKTLLPHVKGTIQKKDLYTENTFIDVFDLLGSVQDDMQKALKYYDFSFYVASLLNSEITSQEAKIINQTSDRNRSEKCIDLLFESYAKNPDKKHLEKAFLYAEKSKSIVLKDIIRKKTLLELHPKDSLLLYEQQLLQKQETLTNNLINEQFKNPNSKSLHTFSKHLNSVSIELKSVKEKIQKKFSKIENPKIIFGELINKLTKDKAVLIEYFYGKNAIYQFVISNDKSTFSKIDLSEENRKSIVDFIHLFDKASIINNDVKNFTDKSYKIYQLLQLASVSKNKNLLIIPDGLLNFIPFEALLSAKTETLRFKKMPFLVQNHLVCYNSSAEFYLKENNLHKGEKMLGIFPVFKNTNKELTYSIDEASAIKKEMKIDLLMNEKATKSAFIKSIFNYNILHLSTHAKGGGFTQPAVIEFYDDVLPLNELYSLNLNANLVVLSACETGVGKLQRGEGAMSIARGFQYAGAKNILFSLWQINDKSTSEIMQKFYKNFSSLHSVSSANRLSKIEYLEDSSISNSKKSPYYWSAFVYYGNFTKPIIKNNYFYVFVGIGVLIILVFLFLRYKKRHLI